MGERSTLVSESWSLDLPVELYIVLLKKKKKQEQDDDEITVFADFNT